MPATGPEGRGGIRRPVYAALQMVTFMNALPGGCPKYANALIDAGYDSMDSLRRMDEESMKASIYFDPYSISQFMSIRLLQELGIKRGHRRHYYYF